jgi:4,5-DOPA dioxygenase extradiol
MAHKRMPVLFIGHGNPMNAIEDNEFSRAWSAAGQALPRPKAILCVSAHWETAGVKVTAMEQPKTIHDFYGFPRELFELQYPAPGAPDVAELVRHAIKLTAVQPDMQWGLDHGTWSVLTRMFPQADVPVVQLSLDRTQAAPFHYALGQQLKELRDEDVLIVGSGNVVHNLRLAVFEDTAYDWALDFDGKIKQWIVDGDHDALVQYHKHGQTAALAINSAEHYLPLLYTLGLQDEGEPIEFFAEKVWGGSVSMRCVRFG